MKEKINYGSISKDDPETFMPSLTVREKRNTPYYLPIVFLIALVTVIVIDVLVG